MDARLNVDFNLENSGEFSERLGRKESLDFWRFEI